MSASGSILRPAALVVLMALAVGACAKKQPPIARPTPPPPAETTTPAERPAPPPQPVDTPPIVPSEPTLAVEDLDSRSLDELNRESPFQPVLFAFDSYEVDAAGQTVLNQNAELMRKYPTWVLTIEGHCDERGTAEYNLALGERRALAARNYLVTLGIPAERLRTVSYGKEFPFDPAQNEEAYAKNRRAHFVITSK
ncbi:MAG: peptidoglycan-associated lipoprotein Pal [Vicinamibacteraceae bacterium]|nr:peptidoglycan-associated lipoprotein Pal [Vicinamibacteraceae bacterium]